MAELDDLAGVIGRAEQFDTSSQETVPEVAVEPQTDIDAAMMRARVILKTLEGGAKLLADSRLMLSDEDLESGQASLAPLIQKYNLAGDGSGNIPFAEEVAAGFYLGGLWKRFRRALADLRAKDKAESEKRNNQQQANSSDGNQRKHRPEEQAHAVPGEVGVREESDPEAPRWLR